MCKVGRMRNSHVGLAAALLGVLLTSPGCGENSRACGDGTKEVDGYCVALDTCGFGTVFNAQIKQCVPDGSVVCSDGTVFDALTGECKIDEASCGNGTVLIEDACVDPTAGLVIDVQEGPEPNGLGVLEASEAQAGNIILKPTGPFVVHGTLDPFRDIDMDSALDPDVDTFVVTIGSPVFVKITADGVNGTAAGFVAVAVDADAPLDTWKRVGMSLVSDAAVREVYLPRAGTYHLAIADTRTLIDYVTTGTSKTAPGGDTSEYYVSISPFTPPAPTALTLAPDRVTVNGSKPSGQLALFTAPLGTGLNVVDLSMPSGLVAEALVIKKNDELHSSASSSGAPLRSFVGGLAPGDEAVIIVDDVYTFLPTAEAFTLTVVSSNATPLSTTGTAVTATATANNGTDFTRLNLWSFDASADNTTFGMNLTFSPAVVGQIYDETAVRAATFTSPSTATTWSTFRGLVRVPRAGRYYVATYSPGATSTTVITATATITELTPAAVTEGTPLTSPVNAFRAVPFTYAAGTADAWQQFNISGVNTGGQTGSWFDPATAYGRLDALVTSGGTLQSEVTPIFSKVFPVGGGMFGRVLLSDPTLDYFVKVNATAPTTSPTVTLTFDKRANMVDLGAIAAGGMATRDGEPLTVANPVRYYLVRAPIGKTVAITVHPVQATTNTTIQRRNADETALGALVNNGLVGANDTVSFTQTGTDWSAFSVGSAITPAATTTYNVTVTVQ
jgi:hypothetical protein